MSMGMTDFFEATRQNIASDLVQIVCIFHDDGVPAFFYTIGLHEKRMPELLLIGPMPVPVAHSLLCGALYEFLEWGPPCDHAVDREIAPVPIVYRKVDAIKAAPWMTRAIEYYNEPVETMQLVWPDPDGRFPWHSGNKCVHAQGYLIDFSQEMRQ
jgi:hypothetical protein